MKRFILLLFLLVTIHRVDAEVRTGYQVLDRKLNIRECLDLAKTARKSFIEDDFGEIIDEYTYSYIAKNAEITVLCLAEKETVIIFVAVQDGDVVEIIEIFDNFLSDKTKKR